MRASGDGDEQVHVFRHELYDLLKFKQNTSSPLLLLSGYYVSTQSLVNTCSLGLLHSVDPLLINLIPIITV